MFEPITQYFWKLAKIMSSLKYMSKGWNGFTSIAYEMEESCDVNETFEMDLCIDLHRSCCLFCMWECKHSVDGLLNMFYPFFGIVVSKMIFFILQVGVSDVELFKMLVFFVFSMFWRSYLACSKIRSDHIDVSLMLNFNKIHAI